MGGSVTLPATFRNFGIIFKHYNELAQIFMIVLGSSTISQMYEVSSGVIDCGSQRHDSLFNYNSILEECIGLDENKQQAAKNLKKFYRHLKKVSSNSSLTDFTKTIPLSITLVSLGKTAQGWDHNCDANRWMGGGIGGFLFCVECEESIIDDSSEDREDRSRNESSVTTASDHQDIPSDDDIRFVNNNSSESLYETSNNDDSDSVDDEAEVDEEEEEYRVSSDESMGGFVLREPCSRNDKHNPKWAYNFRTDQERNKNKNRKRQNNPNIDVSSSNSTSSNSGDSEFEPGCFSRYLYVFDFKTDDVPPKYPLAINMNPSTKTKCRNHLNPAHLCFARSHTSIMRRQTFCIYDRLDKHPHGDDLTAEKEKHKSKLESEVLRQGCQQLSLIPMFSQPVAYPLVKLLLNGGDSFKRRDCRVEGKNYGVSLGYARYQKSDWKGSRHYNNICCLH
eukprot:scaffold21775_cov39-Cyclotella_meneghiniana.AAC.5